MLPRSLRLAVLVLGTAACAPATASRPLTPADVVRRDGGIPPYVQADVDFISGMIGHHAQAIVMAKMAPANGASASIQGLAARIAVAQQDEIDFMARWLRARNQPVPDPNAHAGHGAHDHAAMMPGMLSPGQMAELSQARGPLFDRLFLTFMIQHHEGAIAMVEHLLTVPGAARDEDVYKFAADVNVDQITEIDRMREMLAAMPPASRTP